MKTFTSHKYPLKKCMGQNFLRDDMVLNAIIEHADLHENEYVLEIGCGDGVLTRKLLATPIKKLIVVELDERWATLAKNELPPKKLVVYNEDILDFDFIARLTPDSAMWSIVANIPYCITSPILKRILAWKKHLRQAVIMVQEEIAQKIVKTRGKDYTPLSLVLQYNFTCALHEKVAPESFFPAPKVYSRVIQLIPRYDAPEIQNPDEFWKFVALMFSQPRRMMGNNLKASKYFDKLPEEFKNKRAQELLLNEIIELWHKIGA